MRKLLFELLVSVLIVAALWFALSRINWMSTLGIEKATKDTEVRIGEIFWNMMKNSDKEITEPSVLLPVDSILNYVCIKNKINRAKIKFHILEKDEINAFALPDNHLIVYSGLLNCCENESELAGVLSHELAHLEMKHIMNKLIKDFGLSVLITISTGNSNSGIIQKVLSRLSSSAYDRKLESEADMTAVDYLINAGIDPQKFADFLYRLSDKDKNLPSQLHWLSNHPDSRQRADQITAILGNRTIHPASVIGESGWKLLKKHLIETE